MSRRESRGTISVEDYIAGEESRNVRHEYINGEIHAMGGASTRHNTIAGNIFAAIRSHFSDGPCQVFIADMKVRLSISDEEIFYYPDVLVSCSPEDRAEYFRE